MKYIEFLKNEFKKISLLFLILSLLFFTNCKKSIESPLNQTSEGQSGNVLKFNMSSAIANEYSLTGTATGATTLNDIIVDFSGCTVSSGNATGVSMAAKETTIIWGNKCSFTLKQLVYNGVTYNSLASGTEPSMSESIYINSKNTGKPVSVNFSGGFKIAITGTNLYDNGFVAPQIDFTLYRSLQTNTNASVKTSVLPYVGAGNNFTCALVYPGGALGQSKALCWGTIGALNVTSPTPMYGEGVAKTMVVGNEFVCIQNYDNNVNCLGGIGSSKSKQDNWQSTPYSTGLSYTSLAGGYKTACGVTSGGDVYCWGDISFLNSGGGADVTSATKIGAFTNVTQLAVGIDFACGINTSKNIVCIGNNSSGQLGNNSIANSVGAVVSPTTLGSSGNVKDITANLKTACAVTTAATNNTFCWGQTNDVLLPGTTTPFYEPNIFGSVTTLTNLGLGGYNGYGSGYFYNTKIPWSSYPHTGTPTLSAVNSYHNSATTAQSFGATLQSVSIGMNAMCGANGSSALCFGVDLTSATALTSFASPVNNGQPLIAFSKYAAGSSGSVVANSHTYAGVSYSDYTCNSYSQTCTSWNTVTNSACTIGATAQLIETARSTECYSNVWYRCTWAIWGSCGGSNNATKASDCLGNATERWEENCSTPGWFGTCTTCQFINVTLKYSYSRSGTCSIYNSVRTNVVSNNNCSSVGSALVDNISSAGSGSYTVAERSSYSLSYTGIKYSTPLTTTSTAITPNSSSIYQISVGSNYLTPTTTFGHVCTVHLDNSIWCWGGNNYGQIGNGSTTRATTPQLIIAPTGYTGGTPKLSY